MAHARLLVAIPLAVAGGNRTKFSSIRPYDGQMNRVPRGTPVQVLNLVLFVKSTFKLRYDSAVRCRAIRVMSPKKACRTVEEVLG